MYMYLPFIGGKRVCTLDNYGSKFNTLSILVFNVHALRLTKHIHVQSDIKLCVYLYVCVPCDHTIVHNVCHVYCTFQWFVCSNILSCTLCLGPTCYYWQGITAAVVIAQWTSNLFINCCWHRTLKGNATFTIFVSWKVVHNMYNITVDNKGCSVSSKQNIVDSECPPPPSHKNE